jgi:putative membrane protein
MTAAMLAVGMALSGLVALLHVYFLVLEMFLWQTPRGLKTFALTKEKAADTASLAANQGLYNGFLAAGVVWGLLSNPAERFERTAFFLVCVVVAGLYGAATVNKRIFFVQTVPALLALVTLYLGTR